MKAGIKPEPPAPHSRLSVRSPRVDGVSSRGTTTSSFGVGKRESHDSSPFYARFTPPDLSDDETIQPLPEFDSACIVGDARKMAELPDNSVALVVTSPPYFVGKDYEEIVLRSAKAGDREVPETYGEFLQLLHEVFTECRRVLEPGGRIAVNVANLGRKPYRSLSADIVAILEELGLLLRGEILWQKGKSTSGSCAWGSFRSPANPVLRDTTERVIVASKGRFDRALPAAERQKQGLPWRSTITNDEFLAATVDVWELPSESARRVGHPAPFPVDLPLRLIDLYTYEGDVVLDPFMGSGTTLVAAAHTGRIPVGYDIDPDYVAVARDRLDEVEPRHQPPELTDDGLGVMQLAIRILEQAGFRIIKGDGRKSRARVAPGVAFPFLVASGGRGTGRPRCEFYVDVAGGFVSSRPGLTRVEAIWKTLAQAHVLQAIDDPRPLLVLTPAVPDAGTENRRLLQSVGPSSLFDVVALSDPDDLARVAAYAHGQDEPVPGFWSVPDLRKAGFEPDR